MEPKGELNGLAKATQHIPIQRALFGKPQNSTSKELCTLLSKWLGDESLRKMQETLRIQGKKSCEPLKKTQKLPVFGEENTQNKRLLVERGNRGNRRGNGNGCQ
jgi:hypothetical protein